MLSRTSQWITLREQYRVAAQRCEQQIRTMDIQQRAAVMRRQQLFAMAARKLSSIHPTMEPARVHHHVSTLLTWFVNQKVDWMCGQRRRRSSAEMRSTWRSEDIIAQIDILLFQLSSPFSPDWNASSLRHGLAFQVFHRRDLTQHYLPTIVCPQWFSPAREWYQEVAIVRIKRPWKQQSEVFRATNHIDQPWPRNREVVWSLDRHACQQGPFACAEPTGPRYPRSTSVGDVIVSLLTGMAWVVAPFDFLPLIPADDENTETQ